MTTGTTPDSTLETRGIGPVPVADRAGRPGQLFRVWFAADISILGLPLGASLLAMGMAVWQAVIAAVPGSVGSFAIVGALPISGRRGGAPGPTLSRAVFGARGTIGPTVVSLLSRLGRETVTTTAAAFALLSLAAILSGTGDAEDHPVLTIVCIAIFVGLTAVVAGPGHGFLVAVRRWATGVFGALNIVVGGFLVATVGPSTSPWSTGPPAGTWFGENGLAWVITFVVGAGVYAALGGARPTAGVPLDAR